MRQLTPKEFYLQVSKWVNGKRIGVAQKWCNAVVEIIIQECFFKHSCRVPLLGIFDLVHHEEKEQIQNINGVNQTFVVPEHYSVKFTPCDSFVNDVNGKGITKLYRNRVKQDKPTKRDIERQLRFEKEKMDEYLKQQEKIQKALEKETNEKNKEISKEEILKEFKERMKANGKEK